MLNSDQDPYTFIFCHIPIIYVYIPKLAGYYSVCIYRIIVSSALRSITSRLK
ncbi:hypothetical protein D3C73_789710 [compost metagenome]